MREGDESFAALRDAIEAFAVERAPELVAEARVEATARVRRMLVDAMADALLEQTKTQLPEPRSPRPRPAPRAEEPRPRPEPRPEPSRAEPSRAGSGVYVYGIARAGSELPLGLAGVDPANRTEALVHGDLTALVSRASLAEFGEEALMDNLNDVRWLEEKARAHEHVLDAALARTTVVPLRLCTIYAGDAQVKAMLEDEGETLERALDRLAGHAEWGVKLVATPGALEAAAAEASPSAAASGPESPGAAYLADKRRQAEVRDRADEIAHEWVESVHGRLLELAREGRINPPQNPELSGHEGEMLLNGVYLVSEADAPEFRRAVSSLRGEFDDRGVAIDISGPWPAYNFVRTDEQR